MYILIHIHIHTYTHWYHALLCPRALLSVCNGDKKNPQKNKTGYYPAEFLDKPRNTCIKMAASEVQGLLSSAKA